MLDLLTETIIPTQSCGAAKFIVRNKEIVMTER
jgi:hypothetical protein